MTEGRRSRSTFFDVPGSQPEHSGATPLPTSPARGGVLIRQLAPRAAVAMPSLVTLTAAVSRPDVVKRSIHGMGANATTPLHPSRGVRRV